MKRRSRLGNEGSVLPLTLGYALLAIALVLVSVDAMSLYLAHKRADTVAEAAALAASDGFTFVVESGSPRARLDPADVHDLAAEVIAASGDVMLVDAGTPDGVSARVTVATVWHPPVSSVFVPDGVRVEATATSRTVLR
ncbi:pilus assembly protein TadG-related protein [Microbacterium sp. F1-18]